MKSKFTKAVLFCILYSSYELFSQCADVSNIYSFSYGGKNYEVVKEKKTWVNASACAVERGSYLVEISDNDEQAAVYNAINSASVSSTYTSVSNGGGIAYIWIGATDLFNEGTWLWDGNNDNNGTNFWVGQGTNGLGGGSSVGELYHNWGGKSTGTPKEPDNYGSGQDYAAIGLSGWPSGTTTLGIAGEWNDIIGSSLLYFIIEKDQNVSVNNEIFQNGLQVFPNPSKGQLYVEGLNINEKNVYVIYDITGRVVANDVLINNNEIKVHSLTKGIYYLKIGGTSHRFLKFIKE